MQYSLDARLYKLNVSKKELCDECNCRGRKVSYNTVCKIFGEPNEVLYQTEKKVTDTIMELETERGITPSEF